MAKAPFRDLVPIQKRAAEGTGSEPSSIMSLRLARPRVLLWAGLSGAPSSLHSRLPTDLPARLPDSPARAQARGAVERTPPRASGTQGGKHPQAASLNPGQSPVGGHSQLVQLLAEAPAVPVDPRDGVVAEVELVQGGEAVERAAVHFHQAVVLQVPARTTACPVRTELPSLWASRIHPAASQ